MDLTQEQLRARYHKEAGAQGASSSVLVIGAGFALLAAAGLGLGLLVLGVCQLIDSLREMHRAPKVQTRLAGGGSPYPWQGNTPSQDEYDEFWEDSALLQFGRFFFKAWFVIWTVLIVVLLVF